MGAAFRRLCRLFQDRESAMPAEILVTRDILAEEQRLTGVASNGPDPSTVAAELAEYAVADVDLVAADGPSGPGDGDRMSESSPV